MGKIFYPLSYFRLSNKHKRGIDILPTILLGILICLPFLLANANFFGDGGFVDKLLILTGVLTGFYVAALVAAATFPQPDLDKVIRSGAIALITRDDDGHKIVAALTRREFTCIMFGFLAFSALAFTIVASAAVPLAEAWKEANFTEPFVHLPVFWWVSAFLKLVLCFWLAHLVVVTSLGLYYLMDRLYRHDGKITSSKAA